MEQSSHPLYTCWIQAIKIRSILCTVFWNYLQRMETAKLYHKRTLKKRFIFIRVHSFALVNVNAQETLMILMIFPAVSAW